MIPIGNVWQGNKVLLSITFCRKFRKDFFFFYLIAGKFFQKTVPSGCVCVYVCFNCSTILCWHRYCAILLESMLLVTGSQCSLILILELWLYSIWFPRVSVIRSITNLKCHPGSGICCQAVYTFRNTKFLPLILPRKYIFTQAPLHSKNTYWPLFRNEGH